MPVVSTNKRGASAKPLAALLPVVLFALISHVWASPTPLVTQARVSFPAASLDLVALITTSSSASAEGRVYPPSAALDLTTLMAAVRNHAAALQADHLEVDLRRAEARQTRLIDNPVLDVAVGTVPVGPANPPDISSPLASIPNYTVGLSIRPDLARRGSRIERAALQAQAADAQLAFATRTHALRLLRNIGELAVASLRLGADQLLVKQAKNALALARDRVRTGFGQPLDADRAEIELLRFEQQVSTDQGEILVAQAACAEYVGIPCGSFSEDTQARLFLSSWQLRAEQVPLNGSSRQDLRALAIQQKAALAEERLAFAQRVPDPTVRIGYLYDSFVVSGNQQHSVNLSLSTPLSLIDRGQAGAQAAQARARRYAEQRRLALAASAARSEALRRALQMQRQRLRTLQEQVVPRGQAILRDVRRAFEARAVPLTDLNQAQRALDELLLQEATALSDVFRLCVDLIELGGEHA